MLDEQKKHHFDYLLLILGGIFFLVVLYFLKGDRLKSYMTVFGFVLFYIIWAAHHHGKDEVLKFKNVLEYVLIGFTILIFLTVIFLL